MLSSGRLPRIAVLIGLLLPFAGPAWAQQHFTDCLSNTANDATVVLPDDATIAFGDGTGLQSGDEVALVSDDGACAGVAVWDTSRSAVAITVADRDSVAGVTSGYEAGEELKYRIWRSSDGQEVDMRSASYTCSLAGCRSDGVYERNAVYEVTKLETASSLPVELATFEATRSGQAVVLQWRTASETNNTGFEVQHKAPSNGTWSTLSFVEGAGTTTAPQDYRYRAEDLDYGDHEFRLAQIDRDGSVNRTKTVAVELSLDRPYVISKVYPNPVTQSGHLDLTVQESQKVVVRIYDLMGRDHGTLYDRTLPANQTTTVRLTPSRLSSGQYFLRIQGDRFRVTRRMTVVK
jgi:hypothetical protein